MGKVPQSCLDKLYRLPDANIEDGVHGGLAILGLSGVADRTAGRAPRSTPTYPRPRPLASGHGSSNPHLVRRHLGGDCSLETIACCFASVFCARAIGASPQT